ncbi:TVP38/TMEM64 family protein [Nocardia implantans]|uniref:TVP38/TMEM64 family membrane protein n=1 Tax=Nocardia implantans TaxID=3108168 RepID=A0ABU6ARQ6_9NOCA|nr:MULTISPECIES: TVP38/TMEM64 family protein [unclassified Nocardia]MBF6191450.1 TVP38/TMEM64 family protein [Nocardia beijingensis]MEA3528243.1 TVP38/TMEM64 family protein [Nocardia sp. CDC192]MEB3510007.1 TVP38/TMEM64 family protein [Nocardia sp. CDC186]
MTRLIRDPRIVALITGAVALFGAALLVPLPSPRQVQDWATSVGPVFPLLFFLVHALVTVAPIPRTVFTVSAGLLFGPLLGIALAVGATTVSAALAILLIRALDRNQVAARLTHPAVRAIDERLARRGWLAVGSLRLIAAVPFSVINYCCGLSSIRFWPYLIATVLGVLPGTIGTVILGDALTGSTHPAMLALSGVCLAVGLVGLLVDARWKPQAPAAVDTAAPVPAAD